jgi:hypothetical protein
VAAAGGAIVVRLGLAALLTCVLSTPSLLAQTVAEVQPLERGASGQVDKYQITLRPGAALWDVATTYLPLISLEQGDEKAYQLVLQSYQQAYPNRKPGVVQPEDSFTLEVPTATFVTEELAREGNAIAYRSFLGDQLTVYPRHPSLSFRLVRKESPDKAEIGLTGEASSAADLAREVYQVDPPDFVQVRTVRAALNDGSNRVTADLNRKYLDDFRNYRERAASVKDGERGMKVYTFAANEPDLPYVQVEDAVGEQNDPGAFPREFRIAYLRDGTVRRYFVTEPGDSFAALSRPDAARWQKVLPTVREWQTGAIESLPPFLPPVNQAGTLTPNRILVLSFAPKTTQPADAASRRTVGEGLTCLGLPLALVLAGVAGFTFPRWPPGSRPGCRGTSGRPRGR